MILTCTAQRSGKLLSFLRRELGLSVGLVKRLKYRHAFCVNGTARYTDYPVSPGDVITVTLEEASPDYPAQHGPLNILYEDESLIALDKPPGILMHPSSARGTGTLANYLAGYYAETGQACLVHPVSRLDRDTFGVVLIAKNAHIHALLQKAMLAGAVEKTYRAVVVGGPPQNSGVWDWPIIRPDPLKMQRAVGPLGLAAQTGYRVLARESRVCLLELRPLTGRTHQLRLHCLTAGCPILGDPQYTTDSARIFSESLGLRLQQLRSACLAFCHPITGERLCLQSGQRVWREDAMLPPEAQL